MADNCQRTHSLDANLETQLIAAMIDDLRQRLDRLTTIIETNRARGTTPWADIHQQLDSLFSAARAIDHPKLMQLLMQLDKLCTSRSRHHIESALKGILVDMGMQLSASLFEQNQDHNAVFGLHFTQVLSHLTQAAEFLLIEAEQHHRQELE